MRLILIPLLLVACAGGLVPSQPNTGPARADVHRAAVLALTDAGKTIEVNDRESGLVITAWEDSEHLGTKYRHRFRVSHGDGTRTVEALCEVWMTGIGAAKWEPCGGVFESAAATVEAIAAKL